MANGILLCWFHHDHVHKRGIDIYWTSNGWVFQRNGIPIADSPLSEPSRP